MKTCFITFLFLLGSTILPAGLRAQGTAFTYQGRLNDGADPADGRYDLTFTLFSASIGAGQVGLTQTNPATIVRDGLFTVVLDFGANFPGANRWLEIGVRTNGSDAYTTLGPRQPIASTPYAIRSANAASATSVSGSVSAAQLTGTISSNNIGAGSITASMIAAGAVGSNQLADAAVTAAKLAAGAVSHLDAAGGSPANALQVSATGLVGIGTTNPAAGLQITTGGTVFTPGILFQSRIDEGPFPSGIDSPLGVAYGNNTLFMAQSRSGMGVTISSITTIDISPPTAPVVLTNFSTLSGPSGLAVSGNVLAISAGIGNGFRLVNISNPAAPVTLATRTDGALGFNELSNCSSIAFSGNLLVVSSIGDDAVSLVDVSTPTNPILRSVIKHGVGGFTNLDAPTSITFSGNLLAIAAISSDAVTLVDVSVPTAPVLRAVIRDGIGAFTNLDAPTGVAFSGNLLAITASADNAVTIVDVSNPAVPQLVTSIQDGVGGFFFLRGPGLPRFSGKTLAVASPSESAINVIDLTIPTQPVLRGVLRDHFDGVELVFNPNGLTFAGTNLAVTSQSDFSLSLLSLEPRQQGLLTEGWVGIGVAAAAAPLHVAGNVIVSGDVTVENASEIRMSASRFELGINAVASATGAVAIGTSTIASNSYALATGYRSTAGGIASFAAGSNSLATGFGAVALGNAEASGAFAFAAGQGRARGRTSAALNNGLAITNGAFAANAGFVSGTFSTALNNGNAEGDYSAALGYGSVAAHPYTFVWSDRAEIIPPDFTSSSSNQFLIRARGGVGINTANPASELHVNGGVVIQGPVFTPGPTSSSNLLNLMVGGGSSSIATNGSRNGISFYESAGSKAMSLGYDGSGSSSANALRIYNLSDAPVFTFEASGQMGIGTTTPAFTLEVNGSAGKPGGGSWSVASDSRLKKNVRPLAGALDKLLALHGVSFEYIAPEKIHELSGERMGLIAQEVEKVFPDWVETGADGYKRVTVRGLEALVVEGLRELRQEQQAQSAALKREKDSEIDSLKQRLAKLEQLLSAPLLQPRPPSISSFDAGN